MMRSSLRWLRRAPPPLKAPPAAIILPLQYTTLPIAADVGTVALTSLQTISRTSQM